MVDVRALDGYCNPALDAVAREPHLAAIRALVPARVSLPALLRGGLAPYLVHAEGRVRGLGTQLLADLLRPGAPGVLGDDAATRATVAKTLLEFVCGRLADAPR